MHLIWQMGDGNVTITSHRVCYSVHFSNLCIYNEKKTEMTNTSVKSPEVNGEKNIFFQKLFLFINMVPLKSDTISPTSF